MEEGKNQGVYQTERRERKRADFYRLSCVWSNRENYHRLHEEFVHVQVYDS